MVPSWFGLVPSWCQHIPQVSPMIPLLLSSPTCTIRVVPISSTFTSTQNMVAASLPPWLPSCSSSHPVSPELLQQPPFWFPGFHPCPQQSSAKLTGKSAQVTPLLETSHAHSPHGMKAKSSPSGASPPALTSLPIACSCSGPRHPDSSMLSRQPKPRPALGLCFSLCLECSQFSFFSFQLERLPPQRGLPGPPYVE